MKQLVAVIGVLAMGGMASAELIAVPAGAEVGKCYSKITYPAKYELRMVRKLIQPASSKLVTIPAKYKTVFKSVLVKPATTREEVIPATYKNVEVKVKVAEATKKTITTPAQYEKVEKRVMSKAERKVWVEGEGPGQRIGKDGKIYCLVTEPAEYKMVMVNKLITPASSRTVIIPAKYEKRMKRVLVTAERRRTVQVAAVYKTKAVQQLVQAASKKRVVTPAQYANVEQNVMVKPSAKNWEKVLCKTNSSIDKMLAVQNALIDNGYQVSATGKYDDETQNAVEAFQAKKGLPQGLITEKTLDALGVPYDVL